MKSVRTGILGDSNRFNLRPIKREAIRKDALNLLIRNEDIVGAFKTVRDQVIFTNRRIIVVNVQGLGKKISYFSYPYSKILYFGIETAGIMDIDSEMSISFANGAVLRFDFTIRTDVKAVCNAISEYIL